MLLIERHNVKILWCTLHGHCGFMNHAILKFEICYNQWISESQFKFADLIINCLSADNKLYKVHVHKITVLVPNTSSHFRSQIGFFKVILPPNTAVSEYRHFGIPAVFRQSRALEPRYWEGRLYSKNSYKQLSYTPVPRLDIIPYY